MTALQIDWHRCDGHGLCAAVLPGVVTLDEWGFPVLPDTPVPDAALPDARRAAAACPAMALRLEPAPSASSRKAAR